MAANVHSASFIRQYVDRGDETTLVWHCSRYSASATYSRATECRGPVPVAYSAGASCPAVLNGVRAKIRRTIGSKDSSGSDA